MQAQLDLAVVVIHIQVQLDLTVTIHKNPPHLSMLHHFLQVKWGPISIHPIILQTDLHRAMYLPSNHIQPLVLQVK